MIIRSILLLVCPRPNKSSFSPHTLCAAALRHLSDTLPHSLQLTDDAGTKQFKTDTVFLASAEQRRISTPLTPERKLKQPWMLLSQGFIADLILNLLPHQVSIFFPAKLIPNLASAKVECCMGLFHARRVALPLALLELGSPSPTASVYC